MVRILEGTILCDTHDECVIVKNAIAYYAFRPELWRGVDTDDDIKWGFYNRPINIGEEDYLFWFVWMTKEFWSLLRFKLREDLMYMRKYSSLELEFGLIDECD